MTRDILDKKITRQSSIPQEKENQLFVQYCNAMVDDAPHQGKVAEGSVFLMDDYVHFYKKIQGQRSRVNRVLKCRQINL
jgi:hypothetical protein